MPLISAIICAHNPCLARLQRVIDALTSQALAASSVEILLIDNASSTPLTHSIVCSSSQANLRIVPEPRLGLTHARARGFREASSDIVVLVDDDNVLKHDYLSRALAFLRDNPTVGVIGGPCVPEFDDEVPEWAAEFLPLLALRNLGEEVLIHHGGLQGSDSYPAFAPIGAGMVIRRHLGLRWAEERVRGTSIITDRRGASLSSAGDNDIILCCLSWNEGVAYVPELEVTHVLPSARLNPDYLARLNEGIQRSWMQVLMLHGVCPWRPLNPVSAWLRIASAWWRHRAWRGPAERIRFSGAKGHFLGRCA